MKSGFGAQNARILSEEAILTSACGTKEEAGSARARAYGVCQFKGRSARPLGTTRGHTPLGGYSQVAGPYHALIPRQTDGFAAGATLSQLVSRRPHLVSGAGVTSVTPLG